MGWTVGFNVYCIGLVKKKKTVLWEAFKMSSALDIL